tara:strand:- start:1010 stop:2143 length:1134 start_codon:yes stop_codon:yes gene_type:complete
MIFADALILDKTHRTKDGFLVTRARAARTGVYDYAGREVDPDNKHGLRDQSLVKVLRDDDTVFDEKSVRSFIGKPITDDHPKEAVTSGNWKKYARGTVMGAIRDGDYLAFDLLLTDSEAIRAIDAGKRELSNGYAADLEFGDFTAPDGTKCQARQTKISGNHVALVDRGRAGAECRIGDIAVCDAITAGKLDELKASLNDKETVVKTFTLDGLPVNLDDAEAVEAAFKKLQDRATDAEKALTDEKEKVSTLTGEKTALEQKVTDAEAKLTADELDKAVAARAKLIEDAKAIDPKVVTDGKTDAEIRKSVVEAKLGDAAKDLDDAAIAGAFAAFANGGVKHTPQHAPRVTNDTDDKVGALYDKMIADMKASSQPAEAA